MVLNANIESSARRLFPNLTPEQAIAELLLERAQKNLIKYQTMARQFKAKYKVDFESFRQKILSMKPDSITEQDYFDWELAMTGIEDMQAEIKRLTALCCFASRSGRDEPNSQQVVPVLMIPQCIILD
jgi:hypothetical protein